MTLRTQLAILVGLAVLLGTGWYAWTGNEVGAQSKEVPRAGGGGGTRVLVEKAPAAADKITVRAVGTGEARKSAALYPKTAGEVVAVSFRSQDRVHKGQVLLRLEDTHQQIAVRLAKVAVKDATRQLKRLEKLAPSGTASQARLETAQTDLEAANLRLDQAEQALDDRIVYAPFDGIIGLTDIDRGDRVTTDTRIATLDDRSEILVEFELPEEYAGRIKVGDPVTVRPWTAPDLRLAGEVSQLGSRIDPITRTLRVKASIPNEQDLIRPGTSFETELAFTGKPYPTVREVAVLWSRDGAYLWRVARKDGKTETAEKVFVKIVRRDRGRILVDGALNADDLIVVEGVQGLRPGQRIKAIPFDKFVAGDTAPKGKKKATP
ncbi:MAG: efflux RND transporter periplasmic adaptor subunit [Rhodospirillales bacterium]